MNKIIFIVLSFLHFSILIQFPSIINDYEKGAKHRYDELKIIMSKYDNIVEKFFDGDKNKYINARINNYNESIKAEGIILSNNYSRLEKLEKSLKMIESKQTIEKAYVIIKYGDYETLDKVIKNYNPNISIHFEYAEYYGISILISMIIAFFILLICRLIIKPFNNKYKNVLNKKSD